jgi:Bacterial membrane protein YfhO
MYPEARSSLNSTPRLAFRVPKSAPVFVILILSFVFVLPGIRYGIPFGHDSVEHLSQYRCFAAQLWSGEADPRWLVGMNSGLGSPDLFVYGPLPYYAASLFRIFTLSPGKESRELAISVWIALALSGLFTYLWTYEMVGQRPAAVLAALLYMFLPYHLRTDLYVRFALAEFWALAWMPLIMFFVRRLVVERKTMACVGLALSYALLIFTHLLTVLMFSAVPLLYAGFCAVPRDRIRALRSTALGMLLGGAISAVYLLPAHAYEKYISPYRLTESNPGKYSIDRHILFSHAPFDPRFNLVLSWLSVSTVAVALSFLIIVVSSRSKIFRREALFWAVVAVVALYLMSAPGAWLWHLIKPLEAIRYPWRFNTLVALATAGLAALAIQSFRLSRHTALLASFVLLVITAWTVSTARTMLRQGPWIATVHANGDDLLVAWAQWTDPALLTDSGMEQMAREGGTAKVLPAHSVTVEKWKPRDIQFRVSSPQGLRILAKQFYFPTWKASLAGGQALSISPSTPEGLVEISVPSGDGIVQLRMAHGPAELWGLAISLTALAFLAVLVLWHHRFDRLI